MIATFHHAEAVDIIDPQVPSPAQPSPAQPSTETALIDTKTRWILAVGTLLLIHSVSLATVAAHLKTKAFISKSEYILAKMS